MAEPKIEPHRITKPIQMLAVWFVTLVLLDASFLTAAGAITNPGWVGPMLALSAVMFVPLFLIPAFLMQTRFRTELQEDAFYWKSWEKTFVSFKPENTAQVQQISEATSSHLSEIAYDFERRRVRRYEEQRGLFLIHAWRPSEQKDQGADIVLWLHQHGQGPLREGKVEKVEYQLGPKFFKSSVTKQNTRESFKLEVSAYSPMLCLAKVYLKGEKAPIELERYIDFEQAP